MGDSEDNDLRRVIGELQEETDKWDMTPNDPESEGLLERLRDVIAEELNAQLAMDDWRIGPEGIEELSEMVADHVLDNFTIRSRRPQDRHSWKPITPESN
jgi:hypothetical protein